MGLLNGRHRLTIDETISGKEKNTDSLGIKECISCSKRKKISRRGKAEWQSSYRL